MTPKNNTSSDDLARRAAVDLLRTGAATPSEVADLAGVSRQLVRYWANAAEIDWQKTRAATLAKLWRRKVSR
jgi:transposase